MKGSEGAGGGVRAFRCDTCGRREGRKSFGLKCSSVKVQPSQREPRAKPAHEGNRVSRQGPAAAPHGAPSLAGSYLGRELPWCEH